MLGCKCEFLRNCVVFTDYNGINPQRKVKAHEMITPGGQVYYRVFFDPDRPSVFYNLTPDKLKLIDGNSRIQG